MLVFEWHVNILRECFPVQASDIDIMKSLCQNDGILIKGLKGVFVV